MSESLYLSVVHINKYPYHRRKLGIMLGDDDGQWLVVDDDFVAYARFISREDAERFANISR